MERLSFSIIVPAHNEAKYIDATLEHLRRLDYPSDTYEVIVVENGSSDDTFPRAKKFESANFKVLQSAPGVSRARNAGIDAASPQSAWIIFLDADTLLLPPFLSELDEFLRRKGPGCAAAACSVLPFPSSVNANTWFFLYNLSRPIAKTSQAIFTIRRSLFPPIRFNESLKTGEDGDVIRQARRFGSFAFLWGKHVLTSTRRFEQLGWWRTAFYWTFVAVLPPTLQRHFPYRAAR